MSETSNDAVVFLKLLRPSGPWLLSAIVPDGEIDTATLNTVDEVRSFVTKYNGKRNIYYSVNPTRTAMNKKAAKTDIAVIEYVPSDLDPWPTETPEAAKARYLTEIAKLQLQPTAVINSGNGLNLLLKMATPIALDEPVIIERRRKQVLAFPEAAQAQIDAVEAGAKRLMETLGSVAGTQNIDRILRLPGTTNLPNAKKLKDGRVPCPASLIKFNGATFRPEDFPEAPPSPPKSNPRGNWIRGTPTPVIPKRMHDLLLMADQGAGVKHGKYETRSGLLFAFLLGCLHANVDIDVVYSACLDDKYCGKAIYQHCHDQSDPDAYLERQIDRAEEKYTPPEKPPTDYPALAAFMQGFCPPTSSPPPPSGDDKTFLALVNDMAFANLGAWVPKLWPDAEYQQATCAYLVPRKDDEPGLISPEGFSFDVPGKGEYPAIDLFIAMTNNAGETTTETEVALKLCELCGVDPLSLGYVSDGAAGSADEAWDPWRETPAPRLDLTLLPEVVAKAATISSTVSGADIDAFAIGYLVGLAACADTRLRITPKQYATDWSVPLLLWVLLVAPPSSMKTEVIKAARALAASLDMAERERHAREITMVEVGAGMAAIQAVQPAPVTAAELPTNVVPFVKLSKAETKAAVKKAMEEAVKKVTPPRQRVCGDITIEKYIDILGANPGGVSVFRDELSGWLDSLGRYSANGKDGADRAFYCALRDGSAHDRQRMSSPDVHLPHCAGGFFGAVQPDRLRDMKLPTTDGLLQRFMPLIMREAAPFEDREGSDDARRLLKPVRDKLAALEPAMQKDPYGQTVAVPYKLGPEGAQLYQQFANDMRLAGRAQEPSQEFGECLQKMGPMWLSLALLFHLIEAAQPRAAGDGAKSPNPIVPYEVALRADAVIREYFIPHAEQFYDHLSGGSTRLRSVASAILRCEKDEIVLRDVVRRCHAMQKMERSEQIKLMQRFEGFGWLTRTDDKGSTVPRWERTSGLGKRFEEDLKREVAARAALTATIKAKATARKAVEPVEG